MNELTNQNYDYTKSSYSTIKCTILIYYELTLSEIIPPWVRY